MIQTNNCVDCGCDTSVGSGNFVNRIPALTDTQDGWMCVDCQSIECDDCGELTLEWHTDDSGGFVCQQCLTRQRACNVLLALYGSWRNEQITHSKIAMSLAQKYDFELVFAEDWDQDKIDLSHRDKKFTDDEMFSVVINHVNDLNICDKRLIQKLNDNNS